MRLFFLVSLLLFPGVVSAVGPSGVLFCPQPPYPYEARANGLEGRGVFIMNVDPKTGAVASVTVGQSTGVSMLDQAAIQGLSRWKFKVPLQFKGTKVKCPVAYVLPKSTKALLKHKHS
jgi:TonB family protein